MKKKVKNKVFSTVFFEMQNIHLIKDPGMIPFFMQKEFGFKSVVPISSLETYSYKNNIYKDIYTPIISDSSNKKIKYLKRILWIIKNAKSIDILNLYFFDWWTWVSIFFYKLVNRNGLIYVHCDTDGNRLLKYNLEDTLKKKFILHKILLTDRIINDVLWGIQNQENTIRLKNKWPFKNIKYIPNGVYWQNKTNFTNKENVILTVGRIGAKEKRTDLLMEAFAEIEKEFPMWRLRLVGNVESDFKEYIEEFFELHPEIINRIEFVGGIDDREELQREYAKAKIFCLPSSFEGFGLAPIEALSCGDYIIGSDIPSNFQVTNNEEFGLLFNNGELNDFVDKLKYVLRNPQIIDENIQNAVDFAKENFYWEKALLPVFQWYEEKITKR